MIPGFQTVFKKCLYLIISISCTFIQFSCVNICRTTFHFNFCFTCFLCCLYQICSHASLFVFFFAYHRITIKSASTTLMEIWNFCEFFFLCMIKTIFCSSDCLFKIVLLEGEHPSLLGIFFTDWCFFSSISSEQLLHSMILLPRWFMVCRMPQHVHPDQKVKWWCHLAIASSLMWTFWPLTSEFCSMSSITFRFCVFFGLNDAVWD